MTAVVTARDVTYARAGQVILRGASVELRAGELVAVAGPSGSGKSTLLALLAGLERPDAGEVTLGGAVPHGVPPTVGVVLQGFGLVGLLTAVENVEVALQARRLARAEVHARALGALEAVGLTAAQDHLVEQLSGGQQQRVAVARALVVDPVVLVADEVSAELDVQTKELVLDLLVARAAAGVAVVLATHDPDVMSRCDRVVRIVDGRTVSSAS